MAKRFLTVKELSEYMNISIYTIYIWTSQKKIPYVKMDRLVRFDQKVIDKWIEDRSVEVSKWWR